MPRQAKTPQMRAEEALGVARRAEERAVTKVAALMGQLAVAEILLVDARDRLAYAGQDPALPDETRDEIAAHLIANAPNA